jgi:hypothetical protein
MQKKTHRFFGAGPQTIFYENFRDRLVHLETPSCWNSFQLLLSESMQSIEGFETLFRDGPSDGPKSGSGRTKEQKDAFYRKLSEKNASLRSQKGRWPEKKTLT